MRVSDALDKNFLFAGDLDNKDVTLTIDRVAPAGSVKAENGQVIDKIVLYFKGTNKGLVLNTGNARAIQVQHGNEWDTWTGKKVTLFPTTTDIAKGMAEKNRNVILADKGKMVTVPCIRVRVLPRDDGGMQ